MQTKHFFTIILLIVLCNCQAQTADKGYFSLSIGPSFPIGDYASKDVSSPSSGIAKTGQVINFSYERVLGKQLGIAATLHGQRNPIDVETFEKFLANTGFSNWKIDKAAWVSGSVLFGLYGQFPVKASTNIAFTTRGMLGVVYAKSPELNGTSTSSTSSALIEQTSVSAFGLSYLLNTGIKYSLNKKISLLGEVEFFGTPELKFKDVKATFRSATFAPGGFPISVQEQTSTTDGKQTISSINLNFGIAIKL